jgi:hypothetical protein
MPSEQEPVPVEAVTETTPNKAGFPSLSFFTTTTDTPPSVSRKEGQFEPSFLFRGQENWLSKFQDEQTEEIKQEVKALVARWLKIQNVSVLLGAGSSLYATGFVGEGLFKKVGSLLNKRQSYKTLEILLKCCSDPKGIGAKFESFLSQLTTLYRLSCPTDWPLDKLPVLEFLKRVGIEKSEDLHNLLLDIERAIIAVCTVELPPSALTTKTSNVIPHEMLLAKLVARDPHHGRARLFTTNYDTIPEQAMDRLGILYCDGFTGTVARRFNPSAYDLDVHYPGDVAEGRVRRYDKFLHLYKLHGSINWRRDETSASAPYGIVFQSTTPLRDLARKDDAFSTLLGEGEGLAILPTAGKYGETLAMPYAHLFRAFAHSLAQPQTVLFIIGYSGWDAHVNQIVEDALTNPGFSCVVIDPTPSVWARRLCSADYSGRVYCFGGQWGRFEFFAEHVMPDLEILSTELKVAATLRDLQKARPQQEFK